MAQTKRKRRTKHRGNAAGTIETRGRTGRPPTADERKTQSRQAARERRMNTPPSWKTSFVRAALAAGVMFVFLLLVGKGKSKVSGALLFAIFAFLLYVPAGYYMDVLMYRRRQRKKQDAG
jgi:hypothetical protein